MTWTEEGQKSNKPDCLRDFSAIFFVLNLVDMFGDYWRQDSRGSFFYAYPPPHNPALISTPLVLPAHNTHYGEERSPEVEKGGGAERYDASREAPVTARPQSQVSALPSLPKDSRCAR